jgi:hypothetical protein
LYLCPPRGKITFQNNFEVFPAKFLGFEVKPNYNDIEDNNKEVEDKNKEAINKMVNNF